MKRAKSAFPQHAPGCSIEDALVISDDDEEEEDDDDEVLCYVPEEVGTTAVVDTCMDENFETDDDWQTEGSFIDSGTTYYVNDTVLVLGDNAYTAAVNKEAHAMATEQSLWETKILAIKRQVCCGRRRKK